MSPVEKKVNAANAESDRRILELLAQTFPDISAASTEIINLEAILNLPKGTEHFVADLHGEHEAFRHILKNASGNIKRKVTDIYGTSMRESEIRQLCSLIYYRGKDADHPLHGGKHGRLLQYHAPPAYTRVSERIVEIHPLESAQGPARGIRLYH